MDRKESRQLDRNRFADEFWERVNTIKEDRGLSLSKMASLTGMQKSTLNYALWEKGHPQPTMNVMFALSSGLKINPIVLLGLESSKKESSFSVSETEENMEDNDENEELIRTKPFSLILKASKLITNKQMRAVYIHALSYLNATENDISQAFFDNMLTVESVDPMSVANEYVKVLYNIIEATIKKQKISKNTICTAVGCSWAVFNGFKDNRLNPEVYSTLLIMEYLGIPIDKIMTNFTFFAEKQEMIKKLAKNESLFDRDDYASRAQNIIGLLSSRQQEAIKEHILAMIG